MKKISFIILIIFTVALLFNLATYMKDDPKNDREFFRITEYMGSKVKAVQSDVKHIWHSLKKFYDKVVSAESEYKILHPVARIVSYPVAVIKKITVKFGTFSTFLFTVLLFLSLTFMFKFRSIIGS